MLDHARHVLPLLRGVGYVDEPGEGFVVWCRGTGGEVELRWLKVREPGRGVGTRLLKEMLRRLRRDPPRSTVYGFTWKANYSARRFYESRGFVLSEVQGVYEDGSAFVFSQRYDVLCERLLGEEG